MDVEQLQTTSRSKHHFDWQETEQVFSWAETGQMNMAYEAIDRHVDTYRKSKIALYFRDEMREEKYTFKDMKEWSNKAGNVLKTFGKVKKGDRVFIHLPRLPELYFAILGTIKLGAIVGTLFEAYEEEAVQERLLDSEAKVLITTSEMYEKLRIGELASLEAVFVVGENVTEGGQVIDFDQRLAEAESELQIEWVEREDGLILHYTSGSTGKPKGVLHVHDSMAQLYYTSRRILDLKEEDIYWCTAHPGWITGMSYGVFGPWLTGTTNVIIGNRFSPELWYEVLDDFDVTVWYSTPSAYRMLMSAGNERGKRYDFSALRHILSVGEPLAPEVIDWGKDVFQKEIHDTWWMTETGAIMIANDPNLTIKPGSMGKAIPGVEVAIIDDQGNKLPSNQIGNLAIKKGWPAMMRAIWNDQEKYHSYFLSNDWYMSGDSALIDSDGYVWFKGRNDDVIIASGQRIGPYDIESKILEHEAVNEVGVVGKSDSLQGKMIKAFVTLQEGFEGTEKLKEEISQFIRGTIDTQIVPIEVEFCNYLPKTRSGKIIRQVLNSRELAESNQTVIKK